MFQIFVKHINTGGILLFTSGSKAGEVRSDNGGEILYHASLVPQEYKDLLAKHGFALLEYKINYSQSKLQKLFSIYIL